MTTIVIQANDDYAYQLYRKLKSDKKLDKIMIGETNFSNQKTSKEIEFILPGKEISDEELLTTLLQASRGKSISIAVARKKTFSKIAAWRKNK